MPTSRICATKCGAGTVSLYFHLFDKYISKYTSRDSANAHACLHQPLASITVDRANCGHPDRVTRHCGCAGARTRASARARQRAPAEDLPIPTSRTCATKCGAGTVSPYFHLFDKYISKYTSRNSANAHARLRQPPAFIRIYRSNCSHLALIPSGRTVAARGDHPENVSCHTGSGWIVRSGTSSNRRKRRTASRRFVGRSARARRPRGAGQHRRRVIRARLPGGRGSAPAEGL